MWDVAQQGARARLGGRGCALRGPRPARPMALVGCMCLTRVIGPVGRPRRAVILSPLDSTVRTCVCGPFLLRSCIVSRDCTIGLSSGVPVGVVQEVLGGQRPVECGHVIRDPGRSAYGKLYVLCL